MIAEFVSIDTAVSDYIDYVGVQSGIDRGRLKQTANDIVSEIPFKSGLTHEVALLKVTNYKAVLPNNLNRVVQILYKECGEEASGTAITVAEWKENLRSGCDLKFSVDCPDCADPTCKDCESGIVIHADQFLLNAHPQFHPAGANKFKTNHGGVPNKDNLKMPIDMEGFQLLRPAQSKFHGIDYHIKGCLNLDSKLTNNCFREYRIDYPAIITDFEEGQLIISYFKNKVDKDGYRMIPNIPVVFESVRWGIREREAYRESLREDDNGRVRMLINDSERARQLKEKAMLEAREKLNLLNYDEWWNMMQNIFSKFHNWNRYEKLSIYERDRYSRHHTRINRM